MGSLIVVLLLDVLVFSLATRASENLLAALAVQLALNGLADLGVIHLAED